MWWVLFKKGIAGFLFYIPIVGVIICLFMNILGKKNMDLLTRFFSGKKMSYINTAQN
jgi:hypothetical protein